MKTIHRCVALYALMAIFTLASATPPWLLMHDTTGRNGKASVTVGAFETEAQCHKELTDLIQKIHALTARNGTVTSLPNGVMTPNKRDTWHCAEERTP